MKVKMFLNFSHHLQSAQPVLYHKLDVKNSFAFVLQFFSLISDGLGVVFIYCFWEISTYILLILIGSVGTMYCLRCNVLFTLNTTVCGTI